MKTKEEKQKKFVTEFDINGEKDIFMLQLFPKLKILLDKEKQQRKL